MLKMNLTLSERLIHSLVPLAVLDASNRHIGSATGFILMFFESEEYPVPVIVTNRHVFENAHAIGVTFTAANATGEPDVGRSVNAVISADHAIMHPISTVDLAILPIANALETLSASGNAPFYAYVESSLIPPEDEWENMDAVERVIMAGYPKGMRDTVNNLPIVRSGITATPPRYDYMGSPEFLVDMPCFEGCSGSPVFILEEGGYKDKRAHRINLGTRIFLLGVQHAIPLSKATGTLEVLQSDASVNIKPVMPLYLNIGYIVKSSALLDFDPILRSMLPQSVSAQL